MGRLSTESQDLDAIDPGDLKCGGEDRHGDIELVTPGEAGDARLPSTTAFIHPASPSYTASLIQRTVHVCLLLLMSPARFAANPETEALLVLSSLAAIACLIGTAIITFRGRYNAKLKAQIF
jgi:hypothetical protein